MNDPGSSIATPVLRRLLWPLSITLSLLMLAVGGLLWQQQEQRLRDAISLRIDEIPARLQSIQNRDIAVMSALLELITSNEELRAGMLARDRERLYEHSRDLFDTLHQEWGIAHFYFQDAERYNILRVQFPDKTGGRIDRFTTLEAERTGKTVGGIEIGTYGIFILRVVRPVFVEGVLIGYVELGRGIDDILRELHADPAVEVAVTIKKDLLDRERWEMGRAMTGARSDWDLFPAEVLSYSSLDSLPEPLLKHDQLSANLQLENHSGYLSRHEDRDWRLAFVPMLDASGREVGDLAVMLDITEVQAGFHRTLIMATLVGVLVLGLLLLFLYRLLRRADDQLLRQQTDLQRTEALQQAVFSTVVDGIVVIDDQGCIQLFNPAAETIFGYRSSEVLGKNVNMLMPDATRAAHDGYMDRYVQGGEARIIGIGREEQGRRKDGRLFPIELAISETRLGDRHLFTGVVRDISARKRAEEDLIAAREAAEAASRAKSEFLSSMSHELRTPMNAILGFGQLLQEDALSEDQAQSVQEILYAGHHLLDLINDVLDLSSIEAGKLSANIESISLQPMVENCLATMRSIAVQRNIELTCNVSCDCYLQGDPRRLRQVLLNLLSNAIKYNREGGRVWVDCEARQGDVSRITIRDSGIGIASKAMVRLFRPFERLESAYSGIEGAGIGPALSKRLVEAMQGNIGASSTEGEGSCFWIELPRAVAATRSACSCDPVPAQACRPDHRCTVLCIEDNPANQRLVRKVLDGNAGLTLLEAQTGEQGIELACEHHPDLILLDLGLPGIDGFETLRQLRADARTRDIPVVAVTANAMPRDIERGREAGFDDYLTKPIEVARFHAVVDRWLCRTAEVDQ
ncbi:MAG TPA: PAS domain S-box protein [Gammaproteobacteria bacterium]|nr:PAS domain S-box protein [Gammaproteobacteria bacterium]